MSVKEPRATPGAPASEPKVSLPASVIAPVEDPVIASVLADVNRFAEPNVSVPELRLRAVTFAVPLSTELAVTVMLPVPRLPVTVPPPSE